MVAFPEAEFGDSELAKLMRRQVARREVHLLAAAAGGVGKSFIASLMAQACRRSGSGDDLVTIDAAVNSSTLASVDGLDVRRVHLYRGAEFDVTLLDPHLNDALEANRSYLVDTDGGSILQFLGYLGRLKFADMLAERGKRLVVHIIIVGGGQMRATAEWFVRVMKWLPAKADAVLWVNEYQGLAETTPGLHFLETEKFSEYQGRIRAIGRLPHLDSAYQVTVRDLLASRQTVDVRLAALAKDQARGIERRKLQQVSEELFAVVERVLGYSSAVHGGAAHLVYEP